MAVKTIWHITFACGHSEDRDLSTKKADERAGFARWLAKSKCTGCWRASHGDGLSKKQWLAQQRQKENEEVTAWEQQTEMALLTGSEKAVDWGRRVRFGLVRAAYERLVEDGDTSEDEFAEIIEVPAGRLDSASWWIDNRDTAPEDLAEIVAAAQVTAAASNENPF